MVKKVYLLWNAYVTKELLVIASLSKSENDEYVFKYEKDAIKAKNLGCFLPFSYADNEIKFNSLPDFFAQRMLTSKFYVEKFGIKYDVNDEFAMLCYGNSVRNTDNFSIISDQTYQKLMYESNENEFDNRNYSLKK